jgi:hypothetical protein
VTISCRTIGGVFDLTERDAGAAGEKDNQLKVERALEGRQRAARQGGFGSPTQFTSNGWGKASQPLVLRLAIFDFCQQYAIMKLLAISTYRRRYPRTNEPGSSQMPIL